MFECKISFFTPSTLFCVLSLMTRSYLLLPGEKLIPSEKHAMGETVLNEYSLWMNLTIKSLKKADFGGYICTSSNALGKAEGVVRLQGTI